MTAAVDAGRAPALAAPREHTRAALALARVEARRLVVHPVVLAAVALSVLQAIASIAQTNSENVAWVYSGWFFFLASAALIASSFAVLRDRRSGTEELYAALPVDARARTVGHLLTLVWAAASTATALVVFTVSVYVLTDKTVDFGSSGAPVDLALVVVQGPAVVVFFGAVGVAVARWLPYVLAAPLLVVGVFFFSVNAAGALSSARWLAPIAVPSDAAGESAAPMTWHVLYLVALAVVLGCVALLKHGRDRVVLSTGVAGLSVAAAAAALQLA